jgi:hypothetical protein
MPVRNNGETVTIRDVTRTAVAIGRLGKHLSAETNSRRSRRAVFSGPSVPRGYKDNEDRLSQMSFETPTCQDMNLEVEELTWRIKSSRVGSSQNN